MKLAAITLWENVKNNIRPRLYNANVDAEVKRSAAEYGFDDLVVVPVVQVSEQDAVKITADLIWIWGVTDNDVFKAAEENVKDDFGIFNITDLIGLPFDPNTKMMVVTNSPDIGFGAYGIITKRTELAEMFPDGYIAIPSSIHEFIVIPKETGDDSGIYNFLYKEMICSINSQVVDLEEQLSDHPYYF